MMEATNYLVTKTYCKITCEESKEIERFLAVVPQDLTNIQKTNANGEKFFFEASLSFE